MDLIQTVLDSAPWVLPALLVILAIILLALRATAKMLTMFVFLIFLAIAAAGAFAVANLIGIAGKDRKSVV